MTYVGHGFSRATMNEEKRDTANVVPGLEQELRRAGVASKKIFRLCKRNVGADERHASPACRLRVFLLTF